MNARHASSIGIRQTLLVLFTSLFLAPAAQGQTIWYVDDDAPAGGAGTSWGTAFEYIQDALLNALPGDTIKVAQGVYRPDQGATQILDDRFSTFQLINGVEILGGYGGLTEPDPDERDIVAFETILSGDIGDPGVFEYDSFHVTTGSGTDETAVLDGFTIIDGYGDDDDPPHDSGGGMLNVSGSPTVRNCTFWNNAAWYGGGMANLQGSSPIVRHCTFNENIGGYGQGMYNGAGSNPAVTHCRFTGHSWDAAYGGGMANDESSPMVVNCLFGDNYAYEGGGFHCAGGSSPTLINCAFVNNRDAVVGTAIVSWDSVLALVNCTFSGNDPEGLYLDGSSVTMDNCILWENESPHVVLGDWTPATLSVNYSDLAGGQAGITVAPGSTLTWGAGNIDSDPLFADPDGADDDPLTWDDNDYRLSAGSPCTDAADDMVVWADMTDVDEDGDTLERTPLDLNGSLRFVDTLPVGGTGVADPPAYPEIVDMGAYELFQDCNGNGIADVCDIDCYTSNCLGNPLGCGGEADCQENGIPDSCDIASGQSTDCNGNAVPDECDLAAGTSVDCNENGVLDECDILGRASADCNSNGVPDECDTAGGASEDVDGDGIPDECVKWPQPPTENVAYPGYYYGWNEPSGIDTFQIVADDWICLDDRPITEIRWWGSYTGGWSADDPPDGQPTAFHIGIWTDVPAGGEPAWSHPGEMIAEWVVPLTDLNERKVGMDYHPEHGEETCFQYDFVIPESEWFLQAPGTHGAYWISISAQDAPAPCSCSADFNGDGVVNSLDLQYFAPCMPMPPPLPSECVHADLDCDGDVDPADYAIFACQFAAQWPDPACCPATVDHPWGWKTRQPSWNDAAVRLVDPTNPGIGSTFGAGEPIENGEGAWDMAFVLLSNASAEPRACCLPDPACLDEMPWRCLLIQGGEPQDAGIECVSFIPVITQQPQPQSQVVCQGDAVTLSVVAEGPPPLSYQWRRNGHDIPGATSDVFTIDETVPGDTGDYDVVVATLCGQIVSDTATLSVIAFTPADVNGDGYIDGLDIEAFLNTIFNYPAGPVEQAFCAADMNADNVVDMEDVPLFLDALLG